MTTVRSATPDEYPAVRSILNAAMLTVPSGLLARGSVLVACDDDRILGGLVLVGDSIEAVAVRPGRRGQGLGTALIERAAARRPRLRAGFDPSVRPFYDSLGFDITCDDGRCEGVLDAG